ANSPCKVSTETKGLNVTIIGAICKEGIVALSRREVCAPSVKIRKAGRPPGKKGTTGSDFLVFVEQLLNTLDVRDLKYKYL
ncbi:hypothetical protein DFQ28_004819, partial [Apophysomyces sp. BC1034]